MNAIRKGKINFLVLLVYLVTLQVSTGSAFYSIYMSVTSGITCLKENTSKSAHKQQIVLRKHINVNNNEKNISSTAFLTSSFSLCSIKDFTYIKIPYQLSSLAFALYGKLKDRAPPFSYTNL